jgi:hypothetical protein
MDLATTAGIPEEIILASKTFHARLLTYRERGVLQGFLKSKFQSPVTRVGIAVDEARVVGTPLSKAAVDQLYERAEAAALSWPPRFGSTAWFEVIEKIEGGYEQLLYEVLSKTDPGFTLEKANELAPGITLDEWHDLIRVAFWGTPPAQKKDTTPTPSSPNGTTGQGSSASSTTSTTSTPSGSST